MPHPTQPSWKDRSAAMLEAHREPAVIIESDFSVQAVNQACLRLARSKVAPGRTTCHKLFHDCSPKTGDAAMASCPLRRCLQSHSPQQVQHYHQTVHGNARQLVTAYPLPDRDGEVRAVLQTCHPIGETERFIQTMPQVSRSREMRQTLDLVRRVTRKDLPVLLMGESGTGRRQIARLIHDLSPRSGGPFVSLSCTGLGGGELRAELFGNYLPWSSGSDGYRIGLVEAARHGTAYLEEIGDLTMEDQRILLRLLSHEVPHDLRLICSTWHELFCEAVHDSTFHAVLFFRISRYPIPIPPLRRRKEDLPFLARLLLAEVEPTRRLVLEEETMEQFLRYDFPGNLVELRSALIWAALMADGESILPEHLPPKIRASSAKKV